MPPVPQLLTTNSPALQSSNASKSTIPSTLFQATPNLFGEKVPPMAVRSSTKNSVVFGGASSLSSSSASFGSVPSVRIATGTSNFTPQPSNIFAIKQPLQATSSKESNLFMASPGVQSSTDLKSVTPDLFAGTVHKHCTSSSNSGDSLHGKCGFQIVKIANTK